MYPIVQLPIDERRHPNVTRWLIRLRSRPSFVQSETVRPPE
jgi:glutathione S-transferase